MVHVGDPAAAAPNCSPRLFWRVIGHADPKLPYEPASHSSLASFVRERDVVHVLLPGDTAQEEGLHASCMGGVTGQAAQHIIRPCHSSRRRSFMTVLAGGKWRKSPQPKPHLPSPAPLACMARMSEGRTRSGGTCGHWTTAGQRCCVAAAAPWTGTHVLTPAIHGPVMGQVSHGMARHGMAWHATPQQCMQQGQVHPRP